MLLPMPLRENPFLPRITLAVASNPCHSLAYGCHITVLSLCICMSLSLRLHLSLGSNSIFYKVYQSSRIQIRPNYLIFT